MHKAIAQTSNPLTMVRDIYAKTKRFSRKKPPACKQNFGISGQYATRKISNADDVYAVQYKPTEKCKVRMTRHRVFQSDPPKRIPEHWRTEMRVLEKNRLTAKTP